MMASATALTTFPLASLTLESTSTRPHNMQVDRISVLEEEVGLLIRGLALEEKQWAKIALYHEPRTEARG